MTRRGAFGGCPHAASARELLRWARQVTSGCSSFVFFPTAENLCSFVDDEATFGKVRNRATPTDEAEGAPAPREPRCRRALVMVRPPPLSRLRTRSSSTATSRPSSSSSSATSPRASSGSSISSRVRGAPCKRPQCRGRTRAPCLSQLLAERKRAKSSPEKASWTSAFQASAAASLTPKLLPLASLLRAVYVETLDRSFESVCELDLIFNSPKARGAPRRASPCAALSSCAGRLGALRKRTQRAARKLRPRLPGRTGVRDSGRDRHGGSGV